MKPLNPSELAALDDLLRRASANKQIDIQTVDHPAVKIEFVDSVFTRSGAPHVEAVFMIPSLYEPKVAPTWWQRFLSLFGGKL